MDLEERYMKLALSLAQRGVGKTSPNPMVGAVLVKKGRAIGKGYHHCSGSAHAEIEALRDVRGTTAGQIQSRLEGAALYVNLEPCCHWGKTPPCADALIRSGISRVVIAMQDPNPAVQGKGIAWLRQAGIKVVEGILEKEAQELNRVFIKWIKQKLPFVTIKVAQSLDGKIATKTGQSRWISSEESRDYVQRLRREADGILVGIRTILRDNPLLNVRTKMSSNERGKTREGPTKIILDPHFRIPIGARIFSKDSPAPVIVATTLAKARSAKAKQFQRLHSCSIWGFPARAGRFHLRDLFRQLAKVPICHLLVEGGGETIASVLQAKLADRVVWFIAPKIIGGRHAPTSVEGEGIAQLRQGIEIEEVHWKRIGEDFCIEGQMRSKSKIKNQRSK